MSQWDDSAVLSGLISTTRAPCSRAINGKLAAGWTSADVPTTKKSWAFAAATDACCSISAGNVSPNQTTAGRNNAPQRHRGGSSGNGTSVLRF